MSGKKAVVLFLLSVIGIAGFSAENEFSARLAPVFEAPLSMSNFGPGIGASAALEWAFLPFLGVSAEGGIINLGVKDGSTFNMVKGGAGIFYRLRPFERWTFRGDARAGIYRYRWEKYENTKPKISAALSAEFHITPYLSLYGEGAFNWQMFSDAGSLNTLGAGIGLRFNLSELMTGGYARVRGEKTEQKNIFPVFYAWYSENPFAAVRIVNSEPNTVTNVSVLLSLDQFLGQPDEFARAAALKPGEAIEFPVTARFNESILGITDNIIVSGKILVRYSSLGMKKETSFPVQFPVFHRNALTWDDDRRAASYVSVKDPAARLFARYAASAADGQPFYNIPRNIGYAAAIFEALKVYGIKYVIDPLSSYVEMSADTLALDYVSYPYQTLYFRSGDCDDLSVLFCSLLQILGINTAFITVPGHIYAAFETGIPSDTPAGKNVPAEELIDYGGQYWAPVEITLLGGDFYLAWRTGYSEWRANPNDRQFYPMKENWAVYQAVNVPATSDWLPDLPDADELRKVFIPVLNKLKGVFSR